MTLAVNSLFMQLYLLYSHFMDGFAYAGEALVGKYAGAADKHSLRRCVSHLFAWGWSLAAIFAFAYGVFNHEVMSLFSDKPEVVAFAAAYRWWIALAPIAGMAAFIWDGVLSDLPLHDRCCCRSQARRQSISQSISLSARRCQRLSMDGVWHISPSAE